LYFGVDKKRRCRSRRGWRHAYYHAMAAGKYAPMFSKDGAAAGALD
jgi:hypothetical protein